MSNFKNGMSRRDFVKKFGLAAGLAMPFFRSQVAMGQTSTAPVRVLLVPLQHGWGLDHGIQGFTGTETNFAIPATLQALNDIKHQCVFVDGLRTSFWGNAHDVSYSDLFTASVPYGQTSSAIDMHFPMPTTPSLDWMIGNFHQKNVLRLSHNYRSWGVNYHPLCFDNNLTNLPFYTKPIDAYMGIIDPMKQGPPADPAVTQQTKSLLSILGKDADRLVTQLKGTERSKMEEYLTALTSLGSKILNPYSVKAGMVLPNQPAVNPAFSDGLDFHLELIKIAFTLDTHRVAVLGLGQGISDWNWTNSANEAKVGNTFGNDFHHEIAHYNPTVIKSDSRLAYEGWVNWYAKKIVNLVKSMETIIDVDGNKLIDNTIIVLTGEVGNGQHDTRDKLYVVIGGGGNKIHRGRWLSTPKIEPRNRMGVFWGSRDISGNLVTCGLNYGPPASRHHAADLWVSVAKLAGLDINSFGIDVYNYQPIAL